MHKKEEESVQAEGKEKEKELDTAHNEPEALLPREAQGRIGQHLRRIYGEILQEPLPDKFSKLLENLAKTERRE